MGLHHRAHHSLLIRVLLGRELGLATHCTRVLVAHVGLTIAPLGHLAIMLRLLSIISTTIPTLHITRIPHTH